MIATVFEISLRRLLHNKVELLMTFAVPIAFFSIFALIFGGGVGSGTTPKIKVVTVDEVQSEQSAMVVDALRESAGLRFMRDSIPGGGAIDRQAAAELVRRGSLTLAIVIRNQDGKLVADLLADSSDQVASQVATGLVGRSLMMVDAQSQAFTLDLESLNQAADESGAEVGPPRGVSTAASVDANTSVDPVSEIVQVVDVIGEGKSNPVVSMYAAGIAVMFLLFGATGGGGSFLEERENQTLDRLLSTQLTMDQLLLGKWFYMTCIGVIQVSVMFLWAQLVFGVDLLGHLDGFVTMTAVTASAASAFGLFLATLCKTRGQLNGLSVILVLSMSALGGSMVPRYVMSDQMQQYGLWTFNAWALDGYDKVFWRELPIESLAPQLSVLMISGLVFMVAARMLAVRWETD
ncbi:ABC-2 family transporter protein [Rubripirellula lacrimiformis]|uniref:ABC-2 family transporter protein n=1 Tax=Rubripirellula lacrimiformis TaxID=1930273 RepID=A0A517N905_9BACT|nr:ABC transporter permease [Rubripirellula lacrimiformis]QDT03619.1 ABC-2 family transporter protein [Rubripirellula lacrimiformis]